MMRKWHCPRFQIIVRIYGREMQPRAKGIATMRMQEHAHSSGPQIPLPKLRAIHAVNLWISVVILHSLDVTNEQLHVARFIGEVTERLRCVAFNVTDKASIVVMFAVSSRNVGLHPCKGAMGTLQKLQNERIQEIDLLRGIAGVV